MLISFAWQGRGWPVSARRGTVRLVTPPRRSWLDKLRVFRRLDELECRMSATEDALAELDEATTAVADRIDELLASVGNLDATTAAAIRTETERLRGLASDPDNPVPDPAPEPTPEPGV
jgi:uncharacterized coiled-coil protein SlyX